MKLLQNYSPAYYKKFSVMTLICVITIFVYQSCSSEIQSVANTEAVPVTQPPPSTEENDTELLPSEEPISGACTNVSTLSQVGAPLSNGIDEIVKNEMYVVYSALDKDNTTLPLTMNATSSIYIIRGKVVPNTNLRDVHIFGAGYGDPNGATKEVAFNVLGKNYEVLKSAAFDVANVDYVIKNCFGMSATRTRLQFYSPHGHQDHVNHEFFDELGKLTYPLSNLQIYVGTPDYFSTTDQNQDGVADWSSDYQSKIVSLGEATLICGEKIHEFSVESGTIQVLGFPGHTNGVISLLHTQLDYLLLGSDVAQCTGSVHAQYLPSHGRAYVGGTAPSLIGGGSGAQKLTSHSHDEGCL